MSLPSGLIFFLDFTFGEGKGAAGAALGESLYGGDVVGQALTGGVDLGMTLNTDDQSPEKGFYALNNGYSSPTASVTLNHGHMSVVASTNAYPGDDISEAAKLALFDADIPSGSSVVVASFANWQSNITGSNGTRLNKDDLIALQVTLASKTTQGTDLQLPRQVRRLTQYATGSNKATLNVVFVSTASYAEATDALTPTRAAAMAHAITGSTPTATFVIEDNFNGNPVAAGADSIGVVAGAESWGLENSENIPEINIKVDSVSVTALTKKLKAKWTPELGQDLNAYHNLDAEVELTSILSEQIALEIDREILKDLITGATAGTLYWSRRPGRFLNRQTGAQIGGTLDNESLMGADFTGTVSEWYETLVETVNDVSAQIHRKTLRGGANFLVVSPEIANILEFTAGFRANVTADSERGTVGAVNVGSLSKKWDIYVDPYFPRNVVLVGRKGGSFLESGYVYAPYVPLQVTPTIFGVEDFVPRKGVMTRYAKKMVRPDMYGLVVCRDLNG